MEQPPGKQGRDDEPQRIYEETLLGEDFASTNRMVDDIKAAVKEEEGKGYQLLSDDIIDIGYSWVAVMRDQQGKLIFIIEHRNT